MLQTQQCQSLKTSAPICSYRRRSSVCERGWWMEVSSGVNTEKSQYGVCGTKFPEADDLLHITLQCCTVKESETRQHVLIFPPAYPRPWRPLPTKPHASRRQRALPSPPAATQWSLLLRAAYGLQRTRRLTMHCQWGWLSSFLFPVSDLDLWHPNSNSSEIFVHCS